MKISIYKLALISLLFITFFITSFSELQAGNKTDSVFNILNSEIRLRPKYNEKKEERINAIRKEFNNAKTFQEKFESCGALFEEYRCYQSDSAYSYALILNHITSQENDKEKQALANLALMDYYTSVGFFKEASDLKDSILLENLPKKYIPIYYNLCNRYYQNIAGHVGGINTPLGAIYQRGRIEALDSLINILDHNTGAYHVAKLEKNQILSPDPQEAVKERLRILSRYDLSNHDKAIQYSVLGSLSLGLNKPEDAKYYLAQSALYDIRGDIKETTAAKMLAELCFSESDLDNAYRLIHIAFDDADFYNSHLRKDETSTVMRMIEVEQHSKMNSTVWQVVILAGVIFLFLIVTLFYFSKIRKKKHEIEAANSALTEKTEEVNKVNNEMKDIITRLNEVTAIKDEYIMQTLYMNSSFVNNVEERCRDVVKQLKDKKYDQIKYLPYEIGIKEERARIFHSFDKAFLSLFPNFITEFNSLFKKEDHFLHPDAHDLPVEVRIFALLRLGISDPQEVANYLNLSVKTVYVYKTKVKSKSIVDNSEFEARILAIPKP